MLDRFMTALAAAAILSFALPAQSAMAQAAKTETAAVATAAAQDMPAEMRAWQARVEADAEAKKKAEAARKQAAARRAAKKAEQEAAAKAEAERIAAETEKLRKRYWWLPKSAIEAKIAEQEQQRAGEKKQIASKPATKQAEKPVEKQKQKQVAKAEAEKPVQVAAERKPVPFMFGLFDAPKPEAAVLTEEQAVHDATLASVPEKKKFKVRDEFAPQSVAFSGYKPGTIVIDTKSKHLYFVESPVSARRYGVAVGKEGLLFTGKATVGAKQPWPRWIPTKEMIARDPGKYGQYADGMDGGPKNPLGARAIYLYQGKQDTYLRIHGTNAPETIGTASSNGCFRMINEHVIDLYDRVQMGAEVIVL